jgi:hypothetical protein
MARHYYRTNVPLGIMFLKWIGIGVLAVMYLLYDACFVKPERDARIEAQKHWDRQHFNGWRLEKNSYDAEHGLYYDGLNDRQECTTVGYPGYPACPPQQYFVNGQPSIQVPK